MARGCLLMRVARAFLSRGPTSENDSEGTFRVLCKGLRPGRQRVVACLKEKVTELSPACFAALKSTE